MRLRTEICLTLCTRGGGRLACERVSSQAPAVWAALPLRHTRRKCYAGRRATCNVEGHDVVTHLGFVLYLMLTTTNRMIHAEGLEACSRYGSSPVRLVLRRLREPPAAASAATASSTSTGGAPSRGRRRLQPHRSSAQPLLCEGIRMPKTAQMLCWQQVGQVHPRGLNRAGYQSEAMKLLGSSQLP